MNLRRTLPFASLILASGLWLASPVARAQEHPAPAHQAAPAAPTHATEAPAHGNDAHGAGAHHGPEVKLFGKVLSPVGQFGVKVLNFSIFFFGLFFLLKGALGSAFKARTKDLEDQLSQAERDRAEGEAQIRELDAKMGDLQKELDSIMAKAQVDAEAEKQRILEAARAEADQILAQTQAEIITQQRLAERELRALVAELAVEGATERLKAKVQGATAEQVLDRSITQVGGAK